MISNETISQSISIAAILPTYDSYGNNACQVILYSGTSKILKVTTRNYIRQLCYFFQRDLVAQRAWAQKILNQRNLNPIFVHDKMILIPVKFRKPFGPKDGCYGYVNTHYIHSVHTDYIFLTNGSILPYLSSKATVAKKIRHAKLLKFQHHSSFRPPEDHDL